MSLVPNYISTLNSTTTPLTANSTFTGTSEFCYQHSSFVVACKTDQDGTLYVDFSTDGTNWDSTLTYGVTASVNEVHRITVTRSYFRVRFTNGSTNQTYLRIQCILGPGQLLSAPMNLAIQQDADAIVSRTIGEEVTIAEGKMTGFSLVNKFGRNPDIDTGTLPEDIWNGGGVYTGFPTGSTEEFQVFSSNAGDTGTLTFTYLPTINSTAYSTASVTLRGTTQVNTGVTGYRMHTASYATASGTTFNLGEITVRHRTTTANIFCKMPIGGSQTNVAAYTVPAGSTAYIKRLFCRVYNNTAGSVNGGLWVRSNGGSPRLRRPFSASNTSHFEELAYGGIAVGEKSDIQVRITSASTSNLDVIAGYDILLVKN